MAMKELVRELTMQLDSDCLEYGWILAVAKDYGGADGPLPLTQVVYDAVVKLLSDGVAEIGDARVVGGTTEPFSGKFEFYPWPGSLDEQKARLKRTIDQVGTDPGLGEGFWLAKPLRK
jgi:hypothetical protein